MPPDRLVGDERLDVGGGSQVRHAQHVEEGAEGGEPWEAEHVRHHNVNLQRGEMRQPWYVRVPRRSGESFRIERRGALVLLVQAWGGYQELNKHPLIM